ncbi:MAG TPA: hypothetical protein VMU77_06705, partial [Acidimicrobiales bacterium]|nr:hypothetical protein [Acidimicrobiales bacterium]
RGDYCDVVEPIGLATRFSYSNFDLSHRLSSLLLPHGHPGEKAALCPLHLTLPPPAGGGVTQLANPPDA